MGADKTRPLWIGDSLYIFEAAEGGGGGGGGYFSRSVQLGFSLGINFRDLKEARS